MHVISNPMKRTTRATHFIKAACKYFLSLNQIEIIHIFISHICNQTTYNFIFYRSFTLLKDAPKLKLIDFGRSIDMALFPPNTAFKKSCGTSAFVCTEMKLNLPWNYHVS